MNRTALFFSSLLLSVTAQAQVTTAWVNYPGGASIATDTADNVYTVNWEYNPGGDIYLTKRNANGSVLWETRYDNTDATKHEASTWVATDSAGNAIVSGTVRSGYSNPVNANSIVMKFDPAGQLLWRNVYENYFDGSYTKKVLVDAQDNIYVLGLGTGPVGFVTKVKKFAPDGTALWSYFDSAGIGAALNFKFTPDNHILIIGRGTTGSINGYSKIDLNGNNIWNRAGIYSLTIGDAAGDSVGNTYFVDNEYVASGGTLVTKTSPTGAILWQQTNVMSAQRVEVGNDDQPVISGYPNTGSFGAAFMKYTSNGVKLWENLDADGPAFNLLLHAQMKMDAANSAYLSAGTLFEMAICKINSDGSSAWTATAPGSYTAGFDFGQTDNSVYAVGLQTVKFSQDTVGLPNADLDIDLTATPAAVTQGDTVSYTLSVTNHGPDDATGVVASGTLPVCSLGNLAVSATGSCTATITTTNVGTLTQTMAVTGNQSDSVPGNNSVSVSTTVNPLTSADLSLSMTDTPDPVRRGANLVYKLTLKNNGSSAATNVALSDTLPSNVSFVRATSTQGTCSGTTLVSCSIGSMNVSASVTVNITVRPRLAGSLSNSATVTASQYDPNTANNSAIATTTVTR